MAIFLTIHANTRIFNVMHRIDRRRRILQLLRSRLIGSQQELVDALTDNGEPVTQATVSRDLRALGVAKGPNGYLPPGATPAPVALNSGGAQASGENVLSVVRADSLVVVRTRIGHANAIAVMLDRLRPSEMVGCIAGDDTIFLATDSRAAAGRLRRELAHTFDIRLDDLDD